MLGLSKAQARQGRKAHLVLWILLALLIGLLVTGLRTHSVHAQSGGEIEQAKNTAIELIKERGPQLIEKIDDRYYNTQSERLIGFGVVLLIVLPLIGFAGCMLFPLFTQRMIRSRLPNPPMGRLYKLYFVQALVVFVVLFALGFALWLSQFWIGSLGSVTNPQLVLQKQAIQYVVDNRQELVDNYTEIFVGAAQDLGNDPDASLLSVIIDNAQEFRSDPLVQLTSNIIRFLLPILSNLFYIAYALLLIFFLRRIWPEFRNMLRYPVDVVAAEQQGQEIPIFRSMYLPQLVFPVAQAPVPVAPGYTYPPQQTGYGYPQPQQNYGYAQPQQPPQNYGGYGQPPRPPQNFGYNMPPQYGPVPQGYPTQAPNYGQNRPAGPQSPVKNMWANGGRMIWTEVKIVFFFAILSFVLAIIMGIFLSFFFTPVVQLLVELTSIAMIYFIRLDGSSGIIVITMLLVLVFLVECVLLFLAAFVFLLGKVLDVLRDRFTKRLTWRLTMRYLWRTFLRFLWVTVLAAILGIGLSLLAAFAVGALINASQPNWFLSLTCAPLILLIGLNLGMWLLRGFRTLRRLYKNTPAFELAAVASAIAGNPR
ncbi:MAG TPA: hypothetical protein VH186_33465 [Chloroflexia bacterium]|nr:hypothetical protein [Chloroflexia bacterium]